MSPNPILFGYIQNLQQSNSIEASLKSVALNINSISLNIQNDQIVILLTLVLLCWCCFGWMFDSVAISLSHNSTIATSGIDPEEFDYLSSEEAIPAKFNLIDAYIQMNDFNSAQTVLAEIIKQGNNEQRNKAMRIMDDISK